MEQSTVYLIIKSVAEYYSRQFPQYEAEELASEVYSHPRLYSIDCQDVLRSFAASRIIDFLRKEKAWTDFKANVSPKPEVLHSHFYFSDIKDEVEFLLNKIKEYHRTINRMFYWENMTYNHIAELLDKHFSSVLRAHQKSIQRMREVSRERAG